ncbi:MAG TPA: A/G-specific adenine glycosylase, partial [Actinomycetota bacterium]
ATEPSPSAARREALLAWYRPRTRAYPWRRKRPDPYSVLVSEFMLQQTQASRVAPVFEAFMTRFPTVEALATASRADVLRAWGGLGYPRRAVALQGSAQVVLREHGGAVPSDPAVLRSLPGVGEYTAAAVASLAYRVPIAAVDTNVRRILARAVHGVEPDEVVPARIRDDAQSWLDPRQPGSWNQALFDLGRAVCRPAPRCPECPFRSWCRFVAAGRTGRSSTRRQAPFEGSLRQVRGAVVSQLRERSPVTLGALEVSTGFGQDRIVAAIRGLAHDGVVHASPAALEGNPRAKVAFFR